MSKARLPDTDLARVAPLATDEKWRTLRGMRAGWSPISYRPARSYLPETLNLQRALPMLVAQAPKSDLLATVRKAAKSEDEADSNAEVTELLYDFLAKNKITARAVDFAPLTLAAGYSATYWANAVLTWGDRLLVINPDFRRSSGFYGEGLRFGVSAAHERIRTLGADFAEIELALLRFPTHKDAPRSIELTVPTVELFSYEQLTEMAQETLSIWDQVCSERADNDRRKAANDDAGPLFGWRKNQGDGTGG